MILSQVRNAKPSLLKFVQTLDRRHKQGLGFLFVGILFIALWILHHSYTNQILSFNSQAVSNLSQNQSVSNNVPVNINISSIGLNVDITEATITDGTWEVSLANANHWDNSSNPGEQGNIVIYAHNKANLFGPIRSLSQGELIQLTDSSGNIHNYSISQTAIISPNDTQYIASTDQETLTIYTCTGTLNRFRHLIIAQPSNTSPTT